MKRGEWKKYPSETIVLPPGQYKWTMGVKDGVPYQKVEPVEQNEKEDDTSTND